MTQPLIANAILGIDTLWGGDVMCPSGTGRFIADSWFSDEPLPSAYTHPAAARVRESGGVASVNKAIPRLTEVLECLPEWFSSLRDFPEKIFSSRSNCSSVEGSLRKNPRFVIQDHSSGGAHFAAANRPS